MNKRKRAASAANVQLFPFLAVLLCAMGGLIVLLVAITGKNREVGKAMSAAALEQRVALAAKRNEVELEVEFQSDARERTAQVLAGHRAALAALEDRSRKLKDEIAELESAATQLQQDKRTESINSVQLEAQLAQLAAQTKAKEEELKRVREQVRLYEDSFAVVPYEGPNSTSRRPVYIECVASAVILQPEGIRLSEDDFVFSEGPNNPLAAALRAARDYLVKNRYVGGKDNGEPYPLLLVRPEGIGAYYAARHAMTSWGSEFGYELIDADWKIAYRPVDPGLTLAMTRAVEDARKRGLDLVRAAPGRLDPEQRKIYRSAFSAGRGGTGGNGLGGGGNGDSLLGSDSSAKSAGKGRFSTGFTGGDGGEGLAGGGSGGTYRGSGRGYGPGGEGSGSGTQAGGNGLGDRDDPSTLPYGDITPGGGNGKFATGGTAGNNPTGGGSGNGKSSSNPNASGGAGGDLASGSATGTAGGSNPNSSNQPQNNGFNTAGKGFAQSQAANSGAGGSSGSPGSSDPGGANGGGQTASTSFDASQQTVTVKPQSLANKRGRDWGLPEKARNSVPLTRPISVRVTNKDITLLSETGNPLENKKVLLKPNTEESVDDLVKQIWGHVESWNLAGVGMYWRPVIVAQVTPDGQQRFNDLQTLMTDSGLEVKQKTVATRGVFPRR